MRKSWTVSSVALGGAALMTVPILSGEYARFVVLTWMTFSISAVGMNFPVGLGRLYSLGHGAFMLIGSYVTAIACSKWGWPFGAGFVLSATIGALFGVLITIPALRLRFFSLAIVTLSFGSTLYYFVKAHEYFGGPNGLFIGGLWIQTYMNGVALYYVVLLVFILSLLAWHSMASSRTGLALKMCSRNEFAANCFGIDVPSTKLIALTFAAFLGSVAGSFQAVALESVSPDSYSPELSILLFAAVMIGGIGRLFGPLLGAGFIIVVPELTHATRGLAEIIFALLFTLVATFSPGGLIGSAARVRHLFPRLGAQELPVNGQHDQSP
jgi:branched-chain amino acid transport system permease protein